MVGGFLDVSMAHEDRSSDSGLDDQFGRAAPVRHTAAEQPGSVPAYRAGCDTWRPCDSRRSTGTRASTLPSLGEKAELTVWQKLTEGRVGSLTASVQKSSGNWRWPRWPSISAVSDAAVRKVKGADVYHFCCYKAELMVSYRYLLYTGLEKKTGLN